MILNLTSLMQWSSISLHVCIVCWQFSTCPLTLQYKTDFYFYLCWFHWHKTCLW